MSAPVMGLPASSKRHERTKYFSSGLGHQLLWIVTCAAAVTVAEAPQPAMDTVTIDVNQSPIQQSYEAETSAVWGLIVVFFAAAAVLGLVASANFFNKSSKSSSVVNPATAFSVAESSGMSMRSKTVVALRAAVASLVQAERWKARFKSLLAICLLWSSAPFLAAWAGMAWLNYKINGPSFTSGTPKRKLKVLVTGGKMSKASAVARALGRDGHTVFTAEILPYRYCHTRFCGYVSKHYVLPRPTVQPTEWVSEIRRIVAEQEIDLIIPCTAPVESSAYAHLRKHLPSHVRVFAFDGQTSDVLDNKFTFNQVLVNARIPCPETANMESVSDALSFLKYRPTHEGAKKYIVKPAVYDPKARTEILFVPIADKQRELDYLESRNASKEVPYVLQEVLEAPEYGSFAIFNKGVLTGFEFWESAASCLVYRQAAGDHYDQVKELNVRLGAAMNLTGQLTLDLMHNSVGELVPIECNPRIHSAICTMEGHPCLGLSYTEPDHTPAPDSVVVSAPNVLKYWVMDQAFLMAGFWKPKSCFKLSVREMLGGTDALLHGDDPVPFLAMYLLQIPSLLLLEFFAGTPWLKIDFCIGKIVKEGGD